jgi:hypothetical protein
VSEQTHSSVVNTLRIIDVDPLVVMTVDAISPAARYARRRPRRGDRLRGRATAGTTNAGLVDDLAGVARVCAIALWIRRRDYGGACGLAPSAVAWASSTPIR